VSLASWRGTAVVSVVNGFVRCLNTVSIQANASLFVIIFDAACAFAQLSHHKVTPAAWISAAKARAAVMFSLCTDSSLEPEDPPV
jgi:hypothetical protein